MTAALIAWRAESKQVKQVPDRRRVLRHISIVGAYNGIGKVVAAAIADRGQVPVALDELENGNVVGILMRNVAGLGEGRDHDQRSEEHTSELQSQSNLVCRLLLEKKNINFNTSKSLRTTKAS